MYESNLKSSGQQEDPPDHDSKPHFLIKNKKTNGNHSRFASSSGDSDDESARPPVMLSRKNKLSRQDTFYDVNYEAVKVSTVPTSLDGWALFMDMLKNERRKFQLFVTTLRIERGKILKEFEQFSDMFNDAKLHIKAQFETTMTDLKSVNCARLLAGEVNKRSSSFIKMSSSLKAPMKAKSIRSTSMTSSLNTALFSVREKFGGADDFDEDEYEDDEDLSSKSGASSHLPRPTVPIEYEVDGKTERRNKLRKKSTVTTFHVSTQTAESGPTVVPPSATSRLEKFRKESNLAETFQYHTRPHALSQPFLGFIRKHEKVYAREIGLMRIALREFKGIYEHIKLRLDNTMTMASSEDASLTLRNSLHQLQMMLSDGNWVFDPKFFMRKVQMNPLEDPVDVSAQTEIINSYTIALSENEAQIQQAESENDLDRVSTLKEVQSEIKNLLTDLHNRVKEKGGWRALLYTATGAMDLNMSLKPWSATDQVLIMQEKLRYVQLKSAEREAEHEKAVKHLHETIEQSRRKDHRQSFSNNRARAGQAPHSSPKSSQHSHSARSMSLSSGSSPPKKSNSAQSLHQHTTSVEPHEIAPNVPSPHRHTLAHLERDNGVLETSAPQSARSIASLIADASLDDLIQKVPSLDAYNEPPPTSMGKIPPEFEANLSRMVGTITELHAALEVSHRQHDQQKAYIAKLERQLLEARMTDELGPDTLTFSAIDGGNSVLSLASNEILDEYQQIGSHNNSFSERGVSQPRGMGPTAHNLTSHQVAASTEGISGARRGSTLVMHRDTNHLEYVPLGKAVTNQTLRITVSNEQRDHKHLLLSRPTSASVLGSPHNFKKTFANVLGSSAVGGKGPVDRFRQVEIERRREQAIQTLHASKSQSQGPSIRAGLFPLPVSSALPLQQQSEVHFPLLQVRPPSPQQLRKQSESRIMNELSTLVDANDSVPGSSPSKPESPGLQGMCSSTTAPRPHSPAVPTISLKEIAFSPSKDARGLQSAEQLAKTLHELCHNLQTAMSMNAIDAAHSLNAESNYPPDALPLQNRLQIGEAAIEFERQGEHVHRHDKNFDANVRSHSPLRGHHQRRPKTAGDVSDTAGDGEGRSYEEMFAGMMHATTNMHSDVTVYATMMQNRYLHHIEEAKKIELTIKRLGRASDGEDLHDQQEVARNHYVSREAFRPKSAAAQASQDSLGEQSPTSHTGSLAMGSLTQRPIANRAHSASTVRNGSSVLPIGKKSRGVTAVPFRKEKQRIVLSGKLPQVDLDSGSITSPRLNEFSAELSNLSEYELPPHGKFR